MDIILLFVSVVLFSSCTTSTIDNLESMKTHSGVSVTQKTASSEISMEVGKGFILKDCALYLNNTKVQDFSPDDCFPSQEKIAASVSANTSHRVVIGNMSIEIPDSLDSNNTKNYYRDFPLYASNIEKTYIKNIIQENNQNTLSEDDLDAELDHYKGHYSFERKNINGIDVLFHKRDFYGRVLPVYKVFIFAGNNEILELEDGLYPQKVDIALKTIKKLK